MLSTTRTPLLANADLDQTVQHRLDGLTKLRQPFDGDETARVAQVQQLLGEEEALATLRKLRWPKGVVCPRCGSSKIFRREAPLSDVDSLFKRHYNCLDCQDRIGMSIFDDLTGLPMDTLTSIQKWAACWYVLAFCSPSKASNLLGISIDYLLQVAVMSHDFTLLPAEQRAEALQFMSVQRRTQQTINEERDAVLSQESAFSYSPRPKTRGPTNL